VCLCFFTKRPVFLIHPQAIRGSIIGDKDLGPSVAGQIAANCPEAKCGCSLETCLDGDIAKPYKTLWLLAGPCFIVIKSINGWLKLVGATVADKSVLKSTRNRMTICGILRIVDDQKIKPAIAVIIEEGGRRAPVRLLNSKAL
jgi:hypothetical protein